jgi:hypothetical protein
MRWWCSLGSMLAVAAVAGCDGGFEVENGRPRVTWVALEALGAERSALTLWLQDPEGDAVDVAARWSLGAQSGALTLAPGSAPLAGLPTQLGIGTVNGQSHRVIWDLAGVPAGALTLVLTVDDRPHAGDAGDSYRIEGIDPRESGGPFAATRVL